MRRIVIAIVLLSAIVTTIFVGNIIVDKQCKELKKELNDIAIDIADNKNSEANVLIGNVKEEWHSRKAIISIFSNHGPLDEITVSIIIRISNK